MKKLRFILLIICFIGTSTFLTAQQINVDLKWEATPLKTDSDSKSFLIPHLSGAFVSDQKIIFLKYFSRNNAANQWHFQLLNYQTKAATTVDKNYIQQYSINIPSAPKFFINNNKKAGDPVAVLSLVPYVKINGAIERITSISFTKSITQKNNLKSSNFASASVLRPGSGEWFKLAVKKDGIYKLDYTFLKSIGVDVNNINPNDLNIYGNAFGKLPEKNSDYRPDDLLNDDILVVDGNDGSFDKGDYILFYGRGPDKWSWDSSSSFSFQHDRNIYARYNAYFLNVNPGATPARIQMANTTTQPATDIVTSYDSYTVHEEDTRNLLHTGQRWYGELFDAYLSQTFTLNIPHIDPNGDAQIRCYFGANNPAGNVQFSAKYKGTTVGSVMLNKVSDEGNRSRNGFTSASGVFHPNSSAIPITINFTRSSPTDQGFLDYISINARSYLKYGQEMEFRDSKSVGAGKIAEMQVSDFPNEGFVWEITNPTQPHLVNGTLSGSTFSFKIASDSLRSFIAFNGSNFSTPQFEGKVKHQDLHGLGPATYLIVTNPKFVQQANRLAQLHAANGMSVHVVTTDQVYNEFSGGTQDPTAIRFFAKMFYDRYQGNPSQAVKYLLLFGDGTYDPLDRVANNNYMVPVYETLNSESHTSSITSDDYFGLLDDNESFITSDNLDIGVGRLIATTNDDAVNLVNKVELYMKGTSTAFTSGSATCCTSNKISTQGDWRLRYVLIGDDEENGWFVERDLEPGAKYVDSTFPIMNAKKIYADAYPQVTTAGGERYPEVNEAIVRNLQSGALSTTYVGHGGIMGAAQERILTVDEVKNLTNIEHLTLFMSATCEFARIDDNEAVSIGEWMALSNKGGAIALMTTTRAVFFTVNDSITKGFYKFVFKRNPNGEPKTFGDIVMETKNDVLGTSNNKRSFMLVGDPALKIALPYQKVVLDSINGDAITATQDTLKALSKVRMTGHLEDQYGNTLTGFNGLVQPSIFDKPQNRKTLGQDDTSPVIDYLEQDNILFHGESTVKNGKFDFQFIVPKDIDYSYGKGKANFYSWDDANKTAGGYSKDFYIGGIDTNGLDDQTGPQIELYLNDMNFANGGMTNETPILIAKLFDDSGINTVGNGIGHDITVIIDNKTSNTIVLNDYYKADLNTYKSGKIQYQLDQLSTGRHTLTFKVWDVNNNSSSKTIEFTVHKKQDIAIDHVLNYPNPFTTHTEFYFEHNQVCSALQTQIQIYTVTGRLVKTINKEVETRGFKADGIPWDGRDDFGDQLARGVYIYRITIKNPEGEKTQKLQKLYLLK